MGRWRLVLESGRYAGAVYSLDGQTGTVRVGDGYRLAEKGLPASATKSAFWTTEGEFTEVFGRYIEPLIRAVISRRLVAEKEDLLEKVRYAVYNDGVIAAEDAEPYYREYWELFAGTYGFGSHNGIAGELFEFFPNTGRYFYIPILPQGAHNWKGDIQNLPLSALRDKNTVKTLFDAAYPKWYDGDAFVSFAAGTLTIFNGNENAVYIGQALR